MSVPITLTRLSSSTNISDLRLFNSVSDFEQHYGIVNLSVCNAIESNQYIFHWEIFHEGVKQNTITTSCCSTFVSGLNTGEYSAYLSIRDSNETMVKIGFLRFSLNPLWIAVVGDSFASGEGNPDESKRNGYPAMWIDERCHRSGNSFAVLAFELLAFAHPKTASYLTFLACAGASVDKGILKDEIQSSQIDIIEEIARKRGRGPDIVILTMGGNDIGFSDILNSLGQGYPSHDNSLIDMRFFFVSHQLDLVADRFRNIGIGQVILPLYFDFTRNQEGVVDASCEELSQVATSSLILAENRILRRLNRLLTTKGQEYGWTVVDSVPGLFSTRGICSNNSLIISRRESLQHQGSYQGAFHPNKLGHKLVAREVGRAVRITK